MTDVMRRLLFAIGLLVFLSCGSSPKETDFKVVVLGFDGVDPDLVRQWLDELPNIKELSETGTLSDLGTTNPPESPVAWASFATGTNPGKHGIFDFLRRDPETYFPDIGLVRTEKPEFLFDSIPIKGPVVENYRKGVPFWKHLDRHGIVTTNLRMPLELPVNELEHGRTTAGLGVPDVRGTFGTYFYLATDLSVWDLGESASTEFGGRQVLLELEDDSNSRFKAELDGPTDPRKNPTPGESNRITAPLHVERNADSTEVTITIQGQSHSAKENQWTDWFRFEFDIGPFVTVRGVSRFYVLETFPEVRLYLMPISFDPREPLLPLSYPADYSAQLARDFGDFKTLGWIHETWGLNEEQIDEGVFLEDLFRNMSGLEQRLLKELSGGKSSLYTAVFTATDSASHMFYRLLDREHPRYDEDLAAEYGDAILRVYKRMDSVIGAVRKKLEGDDLLLVVSDHGFHTWRREFNTNTWLVRNGFMFLKGMEDDPALRKLDHMFSGGSFFPNVDWSRTKAYALGLGHIYINLKGREGQGIVEPGQDYESLVGEIREKILQFRDPDTDERVLENAYYFKDIYSGDNLGHAADIQLSFKTGYRTSWQTALGAVPPSIVVANLKKWSGDHCASDRLQTSGFFVSNRRLDSPKPDIIDIAPTLYQQFGVEIPSRVDGKPLAFDSVAGN